MASPSSPRFTSYSCEKRPRLLKDFLWDDSAPSCSSNGGRLLLRRSRSKATSISISAIHKASEMVINAIKFLPFTSSSSFMVNKTSHSILPRSISRKLSRNSRDQNHKEDESRASSPTIVTPKIKDILRWKSFRDVVEELSTSWYERDFTAEDDFPSWGGENIDFMDPKKLEGQFPIDENEQHSPVSVLDINSPFHEDGESISFFSRSIDSMERRKCMLMKRIEEFETLAKVEIFNHEEAKESDDEANAVEAKAMQLLSQVKATTSFDKKFEAHEDRLLMDFFMHELAIATSKKQKDDVESADFDEMLKLAKSWMNKKYCEGTFDWILLEKSESCIKDMEIGQRWDKFDEGQQEELGNELEIDILDDLFDELLADFVIQ